MLGCTRLLLLKLFLLFAGSLNSEIFARQETENGNSLIFKVKIWKHKKI